MADPGARRSLAIGQYRPDPNQGRLESLSWALADWRGRLSNLVREQGRDAHQVAIYQLAWAEARLEAARAAEAWADQSGGEAPRACAAVLAGQAALGLEADGLSLGESGPVPLAQGRQLAASLGPKPLARLADLVLREPGALTADGPEVGAIRESVREFAVREVGPVAQAIHRENSDLPEAIIAGVARLGLLANSIPTGYGGSAEAVADPLPVLIATEELSRVSLTAGSLVTRPEIVVAALLAGGTEEQKQRWLPAIASGAKLTAVAVTEPDHGSDVAGIQCRAQPHADGGWTISGTKLWCTFAGRAELLLVLCRTKPGAGHRGQSLFLIEKPPHPGRDFRDVQPGGGRLTGHAIPTIGYRGMHTFELAFDGYQVPATALVGGEDGLDRGFYLQMAGFDMGRLQTAARAVGLIQAALDASCRYAGERVVFGRPLRDWQLTGARIALMAAQLAGARQLTYRAARASRADLPLAAALAKLYAGRIAELVTRDAMQLFGASGYAEESEVSRHFVDARVLTIFEGTEEVLALRVIAPALLDRG
ncbi:MAG TPA: acyl-CoA dehydrogenase family protein [Candidatus Dormibacteraeota bacterium]